MEAAKKIFTRAHIIWFLLLNFGLVLLAAGIHFFKSPNNFAMGGTSGISIIAATLLPHMDVGTFMFIINGVLIVLGLVFLEPLAYLLGSTDTILPYTKAYLSVILLGAPWMTASLVLNNQLRFQGSAAYAMVGITSGAILNIGLDPLLIFTFRLGIAGAAWATIISQFVSFCLLLAGCRRGGNLRLSISCVRLKKYYFGWIFKGGLPSLARQGLASVATICLNHAARP